MARGNENNESLFGKELVALRAELETLKNTDDNLNTESVKSNLKKPARVLIAKDNLDADVIRRGKLNALVVSLVDSDGKDYDGFGRFQGGVVQEQGFSNTHLASIDSHLIVCDTNDVHVISSNLPFGAALSSIQVTQQASLTSLDGKIIKCDTDNVTTARTSLTPSAPSAATAGLVSSVLLAANANRKGLVITNTSSAFVSLGLGVDAVLYSGITLNPLGGVWVMDEYTFYKGEIRVIASAALSNVAIQEFS